MLNQIILITDGESNVGENPILAAKSAREKDIRVNTIGIIDNNKEAMEELESIAEVGGGVFEATHLRNLSEALSKVTIKSVYQTIEEVVNSELKEVMDLDMKELNPTERTKVLKIIDRLGNESKLKCLILLDVSGSMKHKIEIAKKSIFELITFLKERKGVTEVGLMVFPGEGSYYELLWNFTEELDEIREKTNPIITGGTTPTGPAIEGAISMFCEELEDYSIYEHIV